MALNINALVNQILFNYVTCNYSSNVMSKVNTIDDLAFNAHWYAYPVADQKLFPLVIQRTQKPVRMTGYGVIICSMETFLAVCISRNNKNNNKIHKICQTNFHRTPTVYICCCSFWNQPYHTSSCFVNSAERFKRVENFNKIKLENEMKMISLSLVSIKSSRSKFRFNLIFLESHEIYRSRQLKTMER